MKFDGFELPKFDPMKNFNAQINKQRIETENMISQVNEKVRERDAIQKRTYDNRRNKRAISLVTFNY